LTAALCYVEVPYLMRSWFENQNVSFPSDCKQVSNTKPW